LVKVYVETELRPSEDINKVIKAIQNVFDYEKMEKMPLREGFELLVFSSTTLRSIIKLHKLLRNQRILDAARKHLITGKRENVLTFKIHKQACYSGKISFVNNDNESPNGPIKFIIYHNEINKVIDWLTPKTKEGRPINEIEIPDIS
jgi:predicted RNA binding protein with dsRBD fold (UPF0201 family)